MLLRHNEFTENVKRRIKSLHSIDITIRYREHLLGSFGDYIITWKNPGGECRVTIDSNKLGAARVSDFLDEFQKAYSSKYPEEFL